jgi:predicted Rossmann-fold nucleotide-binding protein
MKKVATCFGGAMDVVDTLPYKDSIEIGKWLALNEYSVKTGGYKGIMEAFSKGAYESGGHVIGCTCDSFGVKAIPNQYITEERRSKDLFERLANLIEEEDVYRIFIFQIGGAGTLAELFICLDLFRKMKQAPPIYLVGEHYQEIGRAHV